MSKRKPFKFKGRAEGPGFAQLWHYVLRSEQWGELSGNAIKALCELLRQYNGANNGDLSATYGDLSKRGWNSRTTLSKALRELESAGWIIETRKGNRHIGCSLYAVTFYAVDESPKHQEPATRTPPNTWKKKRNAMPRNWTVNAQNLDREAVKVQKVDRDRKGEPSAPVRLRPAA